MTSHCQEVIEAFVDTIVATDKTVAYPEILKGDVGPREKIFSNSYVTSTRLISYIIQAN
jgi:hypothetical protein